MSGSEQMSKFDTALTRGKRLVQLSGKSALVDRCPVFVDITSEAWLTCLSELLDDTRFQVVSSRQDQVGCRWNWPQSVMVQEFRDQMDLEGDLLGSAFRDGFADCSQLKIALITSPQASTMKERGMLRNLLAQVGFALVIDSLGQRFRLAELINRFREKLWQPKVATTEQRVESNLPW